MAEQFAQVLRLSAAPNNGASITDAIATAVNGYAVGRWQREDFVAGKALLKCVQTGAQVVLHGNATQLYVGLAPNGGVTDWDGTPSAPVWTGLRNITGANTSDLTTGSGKVIVVQYEDAIAIIIEGVNRWLHGAMAGRVFNPGDESDRARNIGVDGLLCGVPSNVTSDGNWLVGSIAPSRILAASVARAGNIFNPVAAFFNRFVPPSTQLNRVDSAERFLPYLAYQRLPSGVLGGFLGATKYLRQWRINLSHESRLFSVTSGSNQAWLGWSTSTTGTGAATHNQVILWSQTETII